MMLTGVTLIMYKKENDLRKSVQQKWGVVKNYFKSVKQTYRPYQSKTRFPGY